LGDLGDRRFRASALASLGAVRRDTGDYGGAFQALDEALKICRDLGDRSNEATVLNETGTLHRLRGDFERAGECHRRVLTLAREISSSWDEAHALAGLGRCAVAAGNATEARGDLKQALEIFQRIGAGEASSVASELEAVTAPRPASEQDS
jgi:tetratricopeptide (TPR) repeat protein